LNLIDLRDTYRINDENRGREEAAIILITHNINSADSSDKCIRMSDRLVFEDRTREGAMMA
jgi:hypothetical protein